MLKRTGGRPVLLRDVGWSRGLFGLLVVGLFLGLGFLGFGDEVDPLEDTHFAAVADALAEFDDAGVAAGAVGQRRGEASSGLMRPSVQISRVSLS